MHRYFLLASLLALAVTNAMAQVPALVVTIEISNIMIDGGDVYVALFDSAASYKKEEAFLGQILPPSATTLRFKVTVPPGSYLASAFQDSNGNGKLDKNFIGMPREPIGLSNYDGKGIPSGFDTLKTEVVKDGMLLRVGLKKL